MSSSLSVPSQTNARPRHHGLVPLLHRICVLAGHTFTQLVRMKVFYFLLVFWMIVFVVGFFSPGISPDTELKRVKDVAFGVMQYFSALCGIVAMALLLPKDLEDRTLYTILTKPVRRFEYLLGKYLGVLMVVFASLLVMDAMASGVLHLKYSLAVSDEMQGIEAAVQSGKIPAGSVGQVKAEAMEKLSAQGLTWELHLAVVAIFFKAAVIAAVATAISTFAGSTIFTMMAALCVYVIGHLQATAREELLAPEPTHAKAHGPVTPGGPAARPEPAGPLLRIASGVVAVIFPDFQVYNVVDSVVAGKPITAAQFLKMFGLTAVYLAVFLGVSVFLFAEKEL